jgi:undecaprenyl pyrophosphate phosphatase UppP
MEYLVMPVLGAVQGAAEFLPTASSGRLAVAQTLIKDGNGEASGLFTMMCVR